MKVEIAFTRIEPAGWPPLHAKRIGTQRTHCGRKITPEWGRDYLDAESVECRQCRAALRKLGFLDQEDG